MTPREYIETAMKLADAYAKAWLANQTSRVVAAYDDGNDRKALEAHLREHLDEIIEAAYDKGYEDRRNED